MSLLHPSPSLRGLQSYSVPRAAAPVDLRLDGNEGPMPSLELLDALSSPTILQQYPKVTPLAEVLAEKWELSQERILVTAGADDALERAFRAYLWEEREAILTTPTFEMLERYTRFSGASLTSIPWSAGPYPIETVLAQASEKTGLVGVVSPNNPNGLTATADEVRALARALPETLIVVDHAYVEFGEEDLTAEILDLPNVVVTRTLSKAWGLAGLRIGYALSSPTVISTMRAAGNPYTVAAPSALMAAHHLQTQEPKMRAFADKVKGERERLRATLADLGVWTSDSQANFVYGEIRDPVLFRDAMAGLGIGIRAFVGRPGMETGFRISCPGREPDFQRLQQAVKVALAPDTLLFDMDGVLVDVSRSYRRCIVETVAHFGVSCTPEEIAEVKAGGDANNDWVVSQRLLRRAGVEASLEAVTEVFETLYQGTPEQAGFCKEETPLVTKEWLENLSSEWKLGIVTGRPRRDAERFLREQDWEALFGAVVCMEDAPLKPNPAPVKLALNLLDGKAAWMVGDTPDDVRAARKAGVVPVGIPAPGEANDSTQETLIKAGAARVLEEIAQLPALLRNSTEGGTNDEP